MDRVIALIDMDCFYVQVEQRECPESLGKPAIVVQYNEWKGGGIIAINYEARAIGITKRMRGDDAKKLCEDIYIFRVPEVRGKANLTRYRDAGKEVLDVFISRCKCVEKASIDEAFLDITDEVINRIDNGLHVSADDLENTHVMKILDDGVEMTPQEWLNSTQGEYAHEVDKKLTVGAQIIQEIRDEVYKRTSFRCSAGISYNKILSKLACGLHKPNQQTILPPSGVPKLFETLPVHKVRFLGGKLGSSLEKDMGCITMGDLAKVSLGKLKEKYDGKTSHWLHQLAQGIDNEPVVSRQLPKSIGCSKNFLGKEMLTSLDEVNHWMGQLVIEVCERLNKDKFENKRIPKSLSVSTTIQTRETSRHLSRSCVLNSCDPPVLQRESLHLIGKIYDHEDKAKDFGFINLGVSISKFEKLVEGQGNIVKFFEPRDDRVATCSTVIPTQKMQMPAPTSSVTTFFSRHTKSPNKCDLTQNSPVTSPIKAESEREFKTTATSLASNQCNVSLYELFPDLDNIDANIVSSLPMPMQLEFRRYCQKRKKSLGISQYLKNPMPVEMQNNVKTICEKCSKLIEESKMNEHKDFHFAQEVHSDLNQASHVGKRPGPEATENGKKTRKISSYFTKNIT